MRGGDSSTVMAGKVLANQDLGNLVGCWRRKEPSSVLGVLWSGNVLSELAQVPLDIELEFSRHRAWVSSLFPFATQSLSILCCPSQFAAFPFPIINTRST